jgi:hypothetical protein
MILKCPDIAQRDQNIAAAVLVMLWDYVVAYGVKRGGEDDNIANLGG